MSIYRGTAWVKVERLRWARIRCSPISYMLPLSSKYLTALRELQPVGDRHFEGKGIAGKSGPPNCE